MMCIKLVAGCSTLPKFDYKKDFPLLMTIIGYQNYNSHSQFPYIQLKVPYVYSDTARLAKYGTRFRKKLREWIFIQAVTFLVLKRNVFTDENNFLSNTTSFKTAKLTTFPFHSIQTNEQQVFARPNVNNSRANPEIFHQAPLNHCSLGIEFVYIKANDFPMTSLLYCSMRGSLRHFYAFNFPL